MSKEEKSCKKNVELELSIQSSKEEIMSNLQKEVIKEELEGFDPIKENDVNISTSYIFDLGDKLEASVFFRNGLGGKINFDKVPLIIIDGDGNKVASEIFSLKALGYIPPYSARPWKLYFSKQNILIDKTPCQDWKVAFDSNLQALKTVKVVYEDMPKDMDMMVQKHLNDYLDSLTLLKKDQITINTYNAEIKDNNKINITILVRNGSDNKIKIEELPITLYDKDKKVICSISLALKKLEVNPLKARFYKLIINFDAEKYSEYNFENLYVEFKAI
ncbi:SLAP domain-containing protein [Clostridium sp. ZS2-4]|uniref:SLAP domain-containing protein n=1 Tax=Clostridium sp. ZS2-4 TaxID=2987703 RepID=UPI00227AF177|nr:SLAP domain-containing protein [Clostridium sp. ZS2-4]MCY6355124.1 SLAP domain-containing protein [Clostridium sp. ZS2-4]